MSNGHPTTVMGDGSHGRQVHFIHSGFRVYSARSPLLFTSALRRSRADKVGSNTVARIANHRTFAVLSYRSLSILFIISHHLKIF